MVYWLASSNRYLGGKAPKTLLNSEPDRTPNAGRDEVEGIMQS